MFYNAKENSNGGQGGRTTDTQCKNVLIDNTDPVLFASNFPATVNTNQLNIDGIVYDTSSGGDLNFEDKTSDYNGIFDLSSYFAAISHENTSNSFDYLVDIDTVPSEEGELRVILQEGSSYITLTFNFEDNEIQLGQKGFFGISTDDSISVGPSFWNGKKTVRLSKFGGKVEAIVTSQDIGQTIELEMSTNIQPDMAGVVIKGEELSTLYEGRITNPLLLEQDDLSLQKSVFLQVNNEIRSVEKTQREYSFSEKLVNGIPYHGARFDVSLYAQDLSGRQSNAITKTIIYDLSGPGVFDVSVEPLGEGDSTYIEFGRSDALITLRAEDDFSLTERVLARYHDQEVWLDYNFESGLWEGTLLSSSLPIGNFGITFTAYDALGNVNVQTIEDVLSIEDRIDPVIVIDTRSTSFNSSNPTFTFNTDEQSSCTITYTDAQGNTVERSLGGFGTSHTAQLNNLPGGEGQEISTPGVIDCIDTTGNSVSQLVNLIVDRRPPVYTIGTRTFDLRPDEIKRNEASYTALESAGYILFFEADEPVKCKYDLGNTNSNQYNQLSEPFLQTELGNYEINDQSAEHFISTRQDFTAICKDGAGNQGVVKKISIKVDPSIDPFIIGLPKSTSESFVEFQTVRDLDCTYNLAGQGTQNVNGVTQGGLYSYNIPLSLSEEGKLQAISDLWVNNRSS